MDPDFPSDKILVVSNRAGFSGGVLSTNGTAKLKDPIIPWPMHFYNYDFPHFCFVARVSMARGLHSIRLWNVLILKLSQQNGHINDKELQYLVARSTFV